MTRSSTLLEAQPPATRRLLASSGPVPTLQLADVTGGNEAYREVEIPDFGQPAPLPNPAAHHDESEVEAEIKLIMFGWTTTTFPSSLPATTTT